ncbi:MAG TPA: hypothetical protein VFK81_18020 [Terriglobales bacterium]|jgi:hypothetical protein|nr:hypothetical protein [Terriglobales bacterium]
MSQRSGVVLSASVLTLVVVIAAQTLGCGSMYSSSNRMLQSVMVTPANADAQNFTMGQVQFTATGTFSQPPSPAPVSFQPPYTGNWSSSNLNIATISQSGMAQCAAGAAGKVTITAEVSSNSATGMGQMSTAVSGKTTLTCP